MIRPPPGSTLFPYTTPFRSLLLDLWPRVAAEVPAARLLIAGGGPLLTELRGRAERLGGAASVVFSGYFPEDRKSTRLNSSHLGIPYAAFCLQKKEPSHHQSS